MEYTFLLSDESVNSYGTRVLTAGIRLHDFEKNPIVLWNHTRAWSDKEDQILPIGRVTKLWVENNKLYGNVVFDEKDPFARKIESKVEQKIINACSISINVITTSEDRSVIVQGQTRPTIIESSLRELSIVDIPSNKNCVRLYDSGTGKEINFSEGVEENFILPLLKLKNEEMNFKEQILSTLALKDADDTAIMAEITRLVDAGKENISLKDEKQRLEGELQTYRDKEKEARQAEIATLVDDAIKARKITEKDRSDYVTLAELDFSRTKKVLDMMPGAKNPETEEHRDNDPWEERFNEIRKNCK